MVALRVSLTLFFICFINMACLIYLLQLLVGLWKHHMLLVHNLYILLLLILQLELPILLQVQAWNVSTICAS